MNIHTFDNGVKVYKDFLLPVQIERYSLHNLHEPEEEPFFVDMIDAMSDNDCFINIGSAIGYYVILGRMINEKITICGVNPHPKFIDQMKECLKLNDVDDVILEESAVTKRPSVNVYLGDHYGSGIQAFQTVNTTMVKGLTLEQIVDKNNLSDKALYIQMDIQGIEYEIISSFSEKLLKQIKYLMIGTHSPKIHYDCKHWALNNNFVIVADNYDTVNQPDGILVVKRSE